MTRSFVGVNHDLRAVNGRTLVMPAWKGGQEGWGDLAIPDIRDVDTIQKYPVGTKLLDNDRVFYYAKSTSDGINRTDLAVMNVHPQHIAQRSVYSAVAVGAKTVILTIGSDGIDVDGDIAANELAGGYLVVFPETNPNTYDSFVCRILDNTETDDTGDQITLTLQDEVPVALDTSSKGECIANPFTGLWNGVSGGNSGQPVMGYSHVQVSGAKWFWLQTWGPIWVSITTAVGVSGALGLMARHDGSLGVVTLTKSGVATTQYVGFVISETDTFTQAAPFVMLQICP